VEERARAIAAILGVSDFVYSVPPVERAGSSREVGDGLLVVGDRGAVLQVKSRFPSEQLVDSAGKAWRWVRKHAEKGYRQGSGSRRTIERYRDAGMPLSASPVRAQEVDESERHRYDLVLDHSVAVWRTIVIIDHPGVLGCLLPRRPSTFWITLDDWRELNRAIRSVNGLLTYVERALRHSDDLSVPLGFEQDRWSAFLDADQSYAARGARFASPLFSDAAVEDSSGADLYRELLEYVWPRTGLITWENANEYRLIVEFLDAAPPGLQVTVGRWVLRKRKELAESGERSSGTALMGDRLLVYLCASEDAFDDATDFAAELFALTVTRCEEYHEANRGSVETLGVGVLVLNEAGQEYNYQLIREPQEVPRELRRAIEWRYGVPNFLLGTTAPLAVGRNERCPCGSGRKFKNCHATGQ
jgi:uncharacterized protein YecA (UPF0149 family)